VLDVVGSSTSHWYAKSPLVIQKPREVIGALPVLIIVPVKATDVLVVVPLDTVNAGADVILAGAPAPAAFTARTLNVCVVFVNPVNVCCNVLCAVTHAPPLSDTSYRIIGEPPSDGAFQCRVASFGLVTVHT